jgi:hypothetical protein
MGGARLPLQLTCTMAKKKSRSDNGSQTLPSAPPNGGGQTRANKPTFEEIAEAAYQRYLSRGGQHGHDFDDWIHAERSLKRVAE